MINFIRKSIIRSRTSLVGSCDFITIGTSKKCNYDESKKHSKLKRRSKVRIKPNNTVEDLVFTLDSDKVRYLKVSKLCELTALERFPQTADMLGSLEKDAPK